MNLYSVSFSSYVPTLSYHYIFFTTALIFFFFFISLLLLLYFQSGTFPIDLTKTRLQVQGQSQYTEVRYRGMFHALFRIGKEEGVRALYSGYGTSYFIGSGHATLCSMYTNNLATTTNLSRSYLVHVSLEQPQ